MTPLILRYAKKILDSEVERPENVRYDTCRQITQVMVCGSWVDRLAVNSPAIRKTKTFVRVEATDHE